MKSIYLIQPYRVGSRKSGGSKKSGGSLALIVPAEVAHAYNIKIFELRTDANSTSITLRQTWYSEKKEEWELA